MSIYKNPPYDVSMFCIWCQTSWTLAKNEIWYTPFHCPDCKRETGFPQVTMGSRRNEKGEIEEYHEAREYCFQAMIPKSKLVRFIEAVSITNGSVHSIYVPKYGSWIISIMISKSLIFEGVTLTNPPRWEEQ